ncbi:bifunctional diaminohydroxyphosphoribosylaminopyrimidine deaminase/5-amino-6-(5-phosphoribosylamino)uracil reductase RibD [Nitratiruptor sp. YY09-18]|uniref:bifunctional diaminohydroxyphosphoribosylaminopyrimidine deaminase/5-amino-6-(5-phosphoribosylamino)uracil reductase RibD n=1 Tax=Nitratiruptor sp. YY09-18 TaxID=2724901 RepID=UPI0019162B56|nr:bifunctional diaminohydroxyphosphoribosylaminopyrimidine deaminase/5-amino-6-(5-phosphoribosylamino)uracil reductase RibD [Nitratiruptor sp. YY09-18]BCD67581.1 diaminohydroxyphosphoribosylaminopyrimidine deaminase / 5-amino-6-(5-phosphoribosylamino)uracil reductase [Nitratiruptor sp. YY09-18]
MVAFDSLVMELCLHEAWKYQGLTYPNPAVGAAVVKNGKILSIAAHQKAGSPHAEVLAARDAYYALTQDENIFSIEGSLHLHNYLQKHAGSLFCDAELYVTLEPCYHYGKTPPCTFLIKDLGFKRVVISVMDPNPKATGGAAYLKSKGVEVVVGIKEKEGRDLLEPFILWSKKRFIFFKLAQTFNGNITDGLISNIKAREYVHALRDKIDLLVIGGNTVRIDKPILDSRLVGGKAPDILIYSKKQKFNKKIPLFDVPERKVYIESDLERVNDYKFIMIEGGEGMLKATRRLADWYLFFVAPRLSDLSSYKINKKLTFLHQRTIDGDLMIWSRNG